MKKGFSLIELLVSLIIISVIIATLAPVMTKKIKQGKITVGVTNTKLQTECPSSVGSDCSLCLNNQCIVCGAVCSDGQHKDLINCSCQTCADNCLTCADSTRCAVCKSGYKKTDDGKCEYCSSGTYLTGNTCKTCEKGYACTGGINHTYCNNNMEYQNQTGKSTCKTCSGDNVIVSSDRTTCTTFSCPSNCASCTSSTTCTTCNVGYTKNQSSGICEKLVCKPWEIEKNNECINPCKDYHNSFFMPVTASSDAATGICMTRLNAGDGSADTPSIAVIGASNIKNVNADSIGSIQTQAVCWQGVTAGSGCSNVVSGLTTGYPAFTYNSCNRTACTHAAAEMICANFKSNGKSWRLPTKAELTYMSDNIEKVSKGLGSSGLQLCDLGGSSYGSPYCNYISGCSTSHNINCDLHYVWGEAGSSAYVYGILNKGKFAVSSRSINYRLYGFSVRCVMGI